MATPTTALETTPTKKQTWSFREGEEIVPGRWALKPLGGGRRYEAYLAWDDHLGALVVAKLLRPDHAARTSSLVGLSSEAKVLERLAHPVVVRCFGAVLDGPRPHLVLEHLEGPTLDSLIRKYGPLPLEQLLPLALRLCGALHFLAEKDVVHLDVKPRNVIMDSSPRLIDFSIARSVSHCSNIRSPVGTGAYMAPEQCNPGSEPIGPPADVWGLGVTLYRAVAGILPFSASGSVHEDGIGRYPQIEQEPRPLPERVPPVVADVVNKCLAKAPAARPSPDEVASRLEPLVAMLPRRPVLNRLRPRLG